MNGAEVLCSDVCSPFPTEKAIALHKKYNVQDKIQYANIDVLDVPEKYYGNFDIVTFKSVLGSGFIGDANEPRAVENIKKCLKPKGYVIFAENMAASLLHSFCRKHARKYRWNYHTEESIFSLFNENFSLVDKYYCGVTGCFGFNEELRKCLGHLDTFIFEHLVPDRWKYIGIFVFQLKN